MEPDDDIGDQVKPEPASSERAIAAWVSYEGAIKVLRWTAAVAFLIWLLNVLLTGWSIWDATGDAGALTGPAITGFGPLDTADVTTAERIRDVIIGTIQTSGFYPLVAVVAYGFAGLLSRGPRPEVGDE